MPNNKMVIAIVVVGVIALLGFIAGIEEEVIFIDEDVRMFDIDTNENDFVMFNFSDYNEDVIEIPTG